VKPSSVARQRLLAGILVLLAFGGGLALISHAFVGQSNADDGDDESVANPPTRVTMKNGMVVLTLNAADIQNAGIECSPLKPAPASETVLGFATVLDPTPLADLDAQYIDAEAQVKTASARLAISQAALQRAQVLYKDEQNVSIAQLQSAQSGFDADQSALAAARVHLDGVAGSARLAWGNELGAALIGHAPLIDDLIARSNYLVKVTLPPGVVIAAPPRTAAATLYGGISVGLNYISLATFTDPKLQGVSYFYTAAARDEIMPGLNLDVTLSSPSAERGSVVPNSAVIWLEGQSWIYTRSDAKTFVRRRISPNRPASDDGYIVTDLQPGTEVVVHGAQMLLSEEFRAQVPVED
jgi:hypothetical protein